MDIKCLATESSPDSRITKQLLSSTFSYTRGHGTLTPRESRALKNTHVYAYFVYTRSQKNGFVY